MLLPSVELGRLLYVGRPSVLLDEALNRVARDVRVVAAANFAERGFDAGENADTISLSRTEPGGGALARAYSALRAGGWLVASIRHPVWRTPRAGVRHLSHLGFANISVYWHAPSFDRSAYLVSLDDAAAARAVLARYQDVRFGREHALVARGLLRAGVIGLVARDTTVVAQRPARPGCR
jgi:hypothetical protein